MPSTPQPLSSTGSTHSSHPAQRPAQEAAPHACDQAEPVRPQGLPTGVGDTPKTVLSPNLHSLGSAEPQSPFPA